MNLRALAKAATPGWRVQCVINRHSGVAFWVVETNGSVLTSKTIRNPRGAVKRFRSERAANAALARLEGI